jgi:hypothetical protein
MGGDASISTISDTLGFCAGLLHAANHKITPQALLNQHARKCKGRFAESGCSWLKYLASHVPSFGYALVHTWKIQ